MGFFSWKCAKSGKSISNAYSSRGATPAVLVTPDGNYIEKNYQGYGVFGGVDVYVWLAYANGLMGDKSFEEILEDDNLFDEARSKGIDLDFADKKPKDFKPIKIVALDEYNGEEYWELPASKMCPDQGYFYNDNIFEDEEW